jgi:hypothetical protein
MKVLQNRRRRSLSLVSMLWAATDVTPAHPSPGQVSPDSDVGSYICKVGVKRRKLVSPSEGSLACAILSALSQDWKIDSHSVPEYLTHVGAGQRVEERARTLLGWSAR